MLSPFLLGVISLGSTVGGKSLWEDAQGLVVAFAEGSQPLRRPCPAGKPTFPSAGCPAVTQRKPWIRFGERVAKPLGRTVNVERQARDAPLSLGRLCVRYLARTPCAGGHFLAAHP
jgi:hypothetical protein